MFLDFCAHVFYMCGTNMENMYSVNKLLPFISGSLQFCWNRFSVFKSNKFIFMN